MRELLKISPKQLEELINCEMGAHEDEMRYDSGLTTAELLERHTGLIEINNTDEAIQILDCTLYGTFKNFYPRVAERLTNTVLEIEGIQEAWDKYNRKQYHELYELSKEINLTFKNSVV